MLYEGKDWRVTLGYCGPTDCCLVLNHPDGRSKEYLTDSPSWKALDRYFDMERGFGIMPTQQAEEIWDTGWMDQRHDDDA